MRSETAEETAEETASALLKTKRANETLREYLRKAKGVRTRLRHLIDGVLLQPLWK